MKKPIIGVVAILLLGLLVFGWLSFYGDGVDVGDHHIKTTTFAETMLTPADSTSHGSTSPADSALLAANGSDQSAVKASGPQPMDTTSKTILFFGDSMIERFGPRLAAYAKANGHTLINVIWYSSSTEIWGRITRAKELIDEFHPDYIFVSLGGNELFIKDIKKKRQQYVDNILAQIGDIPYIWIGPPNWKPDTGINDMIQESVAPGCFYLSNGEHFDRAKDGAHPTKESAAAWCDRVCKWVMTKSAHPIRLEPPTEKTARCRTILYQPVSQ